jgi:hypothetical protein
MYLDRVVDRMFAKAPDRQEEIRTNPVTGGRWVSGVDPVDPQKQSAGRATRGLVSNPTTRACHACRSRTKSVRT